VSIATDIAQRCHPTLGQGYQPFGCPGAIEVRPVGVSGHCDMAVRVHQADERPSARQLLALPGADDHSPGIALGQQRALEHPAHLVSMARTGRRRRVTLGPLNTDQRLQFTPQKAAITAERRRPS
jgi:hypothetical protein